MAMSKLGPLHKLSKQQVFYIIELYSKHDDLWDSRADEYRNLEKKKASWASICADFESKYNIACTEENVRGKIANLRTMFSRELRLVKEPDRHCLETVSRKWPFFEPLKFLLPVMSVISKPALNGEGKSAAGELDADGAVEYMSEVDSDAQILNSFTTQEEGGPTISPKEAGHDKSPAQALIRKRSRTANSPFPRSVIGYIDEKRQFTPGQGDISIDGYDGWAQGIVAMIKSVTNKKKQKLLKLDIMEYAAKKAQEYILQETEAE